MTTATTTHFSETKLAIGIVEERLHAYVTEATAIDDLLLALGIGPEELTDDTQAAFWGEVEAIIAKDAPGTLGERLAKLRDDGELDVLDAEMASTLTSLRSRFLAVIEALEKVEDDLYSVIHYCGGEGNDVTCERELDLDLDLSDAAVVAALGRASREMRRRFPSQSVGTYEVTNVLLGRDITAGEPIERDLGSGDLIRVGKRLGLLARRGLVTRPAAGCWAPVGEASDGS